MDAITRDEPVGFVARPHELTGREDAYGVYIDDDLNAPVIRAGHVAYVDPSRPVQIGGMVRVFTHGAAAFFAVLEARDARTAQLRVATEARARHVPASQIDRLERVVGFMLLEV